MRRCAAGGTSLCQDGFMKAIHLKQVTNQSFLKQRISLKITFCKISCDIKIPHMICLAYMLWTTVAYHHSQFQLNVTTHTINEETTGQCFATVFSLHQLFYGFEGCSCCFTSCLSRKSITLDIMSPMTHQATQVTKTNLGYYPGDICLDCTNCLF